MTSGKQITVLVEEEYGYRYFIWHTGMTAEQLVEFWTGTQSLAEHFWNPSHSLPAQEIYETCIATTAEFKEDLVKYYGYQEREAEEKIRELKKTRGDYKKEAEQRGEGLWTCHIHDEDDSWLCGPDDTVYRHKGWRKHQ